MARFQSGRLLRANGRWSITHRWLMGISDLKTKCGLTYGADEIYDGDADDDSDPIQVFEAASPDDLFACGECFPGGTARTIVVPPSKTEGQNG